MKFESKFVKICEDVITRFQSGGIMQGDVVKIKKDALENCHIQKMTETYKEMLKHAMETDLNLRVSAVKSIRPTTTQNYSADTDAPADFFVDCVVEYAPGLWRDPITVPLEILERVDTGINMAPVPDSLKRKSKVSKGSEVITNDENRTNPKKNKKLEHTKEPQDGRKQAKKPVEKKANTKTEKAKKIKESTLEDVYGQMLTENIDKTSTFRNVINQFYQIKDLDEAKKFISEYIKNSRINDESKRIILIKTAQQPNLISLQKYITNSMFKYEKMGL